MYQDWANATQAAFRVSALEDAHTARDEHTNNVLCVCVIGFIGWLHWQASPLANMHTQDERLDSHCQLMPAACLNQQRAFQGFCH